MSCCCENDLAVPRKSPIKIVSNVNRDGSRVNQYLFLQGIGAGTHGRVVRVHCLETHNDFACKVLSRSKMRRTRSRVPPSYRRSMPSPCEQSPCFKRFSAPISYSSLNSSTGSSQLGRNYIREVSTPDCVRCGGTCICNARSSTCYSVSSLNSSRSEQSTLGTCVRHEVSVLLQIAYHPSIIKLLQVIDDSSEDNIYLIFELCLGPIMRLHMGRTVVPLPEDRCRKYFGDILLGVEYLHFLGIIHCDIKPENVLITVDDRAKISDFGIAQVCTNDDGILMQYGSPAFTPPEACDAVTKMVSGHKVDVWCMGVTLFCMVHGRLPFEVKDGSPIALYDSILNSDPMIEPPSSKTSGKLRELIRRILTKNPKIRPSIQEIRQDSWIKKLPSRLKNLNPKQKTMHKLFKKLMLWSKKRPKLPMNCFCEQRQRKVSSFARRISNLKLCQEALDLIY